jgi:ribosomal-protein-alanine N-acetyltransferase
MALFAVPGPVPVSLRAATPADAGQLYAWRGEPSVRRHQPLQEATVADLRSDLSRQRPADLYHSRGDRYQWIVLADRRPVGWITLAITSWEQGVAEVGYALTTAAQGQGLMAPALDQLLAELFGRTSIDRLEARCSVDNVASARVLERCGFRREGLLRGYFQLAGRRVDNWIWAILRTDYFMPAGDRPRESG